MEWIRKHRDERKRKRRAARQALLNNAQLELDAEKTHFGSGLASTSTWFFSIRRKRSANTCLTRHNVLERTGEEPEYPTPEIEGESGTRVEQFLRSMEIDDGEETFRNTIVTSNASSRLQPTTSIPTASRQNRFTTPRSSGHLRPIDSVSNVSQRAIPSPGIDDTASQTWLERVSSTIRRKPTIKAFEAYKTGGVRSAWAFTLPKNWKTRNAPAAEAPAHNAAAVDEPEPTRSMDGIDIDNERRSPLPTHWLDREESQPVNARRTGTIAGGDSDVGDWNSPRASEDMDVHEDEEEMNQEFRDWANQHMILVEQYDPLAEASS